MKPYLLRCRPRARLSVSIPARPPGVSWAARRASRALFPDGVVGQELASCPRRIKELTPKWCPVPF